MTGHERFLDLQGAGYCYFSNTGGSEDESFNKIKGDARRGKITFNAIVYGLKSHLLKNRKSTTEII